MLTRVPNIVQQCLQEPGPCVPGFKLAYSICYRENVIICIPRNYRTLHPAECKLRNPDSNGVLPGVLILLTISTIQDLQCHFFCTVVAQQFQLNMVVPPDHLLQSFRFEVSLIPKTVYISISSPLNCCSFAMVVAATIIH
jgi:hypothetical protein